MSSEGAAAVVAAPVILLAPVALAGVVVVGGVMLAAQGAMWCGEQLKAHHDAALASWAAAETSLKALSEQRTETLRAAESSANARYLRALAMQSANQQDLAQQQQQLRQQALGQALRALDAVSVSATPVSATARQEEFQRLQVMGALAIDVAGAKAAQAAAPTQERAAALQQAEVTLNNENATLSALMQARAVLNDVQRRDQATDSLLAAQRERARLKLLQAQAVLTNIRDMGGPIASLPRLAELQASLATALGRLTTDPTRALEDAEVIQQSAETLQGEAFAQAAMPPVALAALRGRLDAMRSLVDEAKKFQNFSPELALQLTQRIDALSRALIVSPDRLAAHEAQAKQVEDEVFEKIDTLQQRAIAGQLAEVLQEQGFRDSVTGQPLAQVNDLSWGGFQVQGIRNDAQLAQSDDNKMVTFTFTADGTIHYDFSGYVGNQCEHDAEVVFRKLRERGIVIADERWIKHHGLVQPEALAKTPLPTIKANKLQSAVAGLVVEALKRMGYTQRDIAVTSGRDGVVQVSAQKEGQPGYYTVATTNAGAAMPAYSGDLPADEALKPIVEAINSAPKIIDVDDYDTDEDVSTDGYVQQRRQISL